MSKKTELQLALKRPDFASQVKVVERMLQILSTAYQDHRLIFEKLLDVRGPRRRYFAESAREIADSGVQPVPRAIPDTPYWVLTKLSTDAKRQLLTKALRRLGYTREVVDAAVARLGATAPKKKDQ